MEKYTIKVERDSVCMGDDVFAPHEYEFHLPSTSTIGEVFLHLSSKNYLASVAGINHSWEAIVGGKTLALFKGNNKNPEPTKYLEDMISKFSTNGVLKLDFKYNSATT